MLYVIKSLNDPKYLVNANFIGDTYSPQWTTDINAALHFQRLDGAVTWVVEMAQRSKECLSITIRGLEQTFKEKIL